MLEMFNLIIGAVFGACITVIVMSILQINRDE